MTRLQAATDTFRELAAIYVGLVLCAALAYMWIEDHGFWQSVYWAGTTATSTGYGDISPKTMAGQILSLTLMHVSIFGVAPLIVVRLVDRMNQDRDAFTHEEQVHILEGIARIEAKLAAMEAAKGESEG
jgi:voltage-gated potassium channel